jgi:hypothetical protein
MSIVQPLSPSPLPPAILAVTVSVIVSISVFVAAVTDTTAKLSRRIPSVPTALVTRSKQKGLRAVAARSSSPLTPIDDELEGRPQPSPPSSQLSSSDSSVYTRAMPVSSNTASVEQGSPSKVPILHAGDITPTVMREFEDACVSYFDHKNIAEDRQVRMISAGFKDTRIKDWFAADRVRICALTFTDFMSEFRLNYLDDDWEETTRRELLSMTQGADTPFWDFAIAVQAKNSLLNGTASHLEDDKLRHQLEAAMHQRLSKRCGAEKTGKIAEFKPWLNEVKRIDELARAERKEFELIAKGSREAGRRQNILSEPSRRYNNPNANASNPSSSSGKKTCPKLTDAERRLLYDNEGCLKCRRFFVTHRSADCPNDFPSGTGYKARTQADVDRAKRAHNKAVAAVAPASSSFTCESESSMDNGIHPVAAVLSGGFSNPVAYMPPNETNVLGNGTDSEGSDVSSTLAFPPAVSPHADPVAPLHVPHLFWRCKATGPATEFPIVIDALFDHGSHAVLISENLATRLGLRRRRLPKPETVELAMRSNKKKVEIKLNEYVKLPLSDPSAYWTSKSVRAIVAPGLCSPIILGLPFLSHNNIVIDHAARTAIDKNSNFDLLNPLPPPAPPPPKTKLKDLFEYVKRARKLMITELKWVLSVRRREKPCEDVAKPVCPIASRPKKNCVPWVNRS